MLLPLLASIASIAAAAPMPAVINVSDAIFGPPEWTCQEQLAWAEADRAARTTPLPELPPAPRSPAPPPPPVLRVPPDPVVDTPVLWTAVLGGALPGREPLPPQPIEGSAEAIGAIARAMGRPSRGQRLRISVWGASHTAADYFTGELRRALQGRWGDGGHGFVWPAAMTNAERAHDLVLCSTQTWRSDFVGRSGGRSDGWYGPGGGSLSSSDPTDFSTVETTKSAPTGGVWREVELQALGAPTAGSLLLTVDDAATRVLDLRSPSTGLLRFRVQVPAGPHRLTLRPLGDGEVRLFGLSLENDPQGVIVDAIGVRGRTARTWLSWDAEQLSAGVAALAPDLVVLAYGTNEAADLHMSAAQVQADLRAVLARARAAAPQAACLVIGPTDRAKVVSAGKRYTIWGRTALVAAAQRSVAIEAGCGFWDWQAAMGGPGAALTWRSLSPPLVTADLIHLSAEGYARSANLLLEALTGLEGPR